MAIYKQIVTVTVLIEADDENEASAMLDCGLSTLAYQLDEGDWIGTYSHGPIEEVPHEKVRPELVAIGNDGTFFDGLDY